MFSLEEYFISFKHVPLTEGQCHRHPGHQMTRVKSNWGHERGGDLNLEKNEKELKKKKT